MHWSNPETYLQSWKQMETLYKEGLVRAIVILAEIFEMLMRSWIEVVSCIHLPA